MSRRPARATLGRHRWPMLVGTLTLAVPAAACSGDVEVVREERAVAIVEAEPTIVEDFAPPVEDAQSTRFVDEVKLESLKQEWLARGIENYVYSASVLSETVDRHGQGCGASGGAVEVEVTGGEPVSATVTEQSCQIDVDDPTRIPLTGVELFDLLADFAAGPAGGVEIQIGDEGFPARAFAEGPDGYLEFELFELAYEEGAGIRPDYAQIAAELADARELWRSTGIDSYVIEVDHSCFCDPVPRTNRVESGAIVEGEASVDVLFDIIDRAIQEEVDGLSVVFNPVDGVPVGILVDLHAGAIDDENEFQVLSLVAATDSPIDLASLLAELGAAVGSAPAGALELDGARFCGLDVHSFELVSGDVIARRCLVAGFETGVASVLVEVATTVEGDPLIIVTRTDGATVEQYVDNSQDNLASEGWTSRSCTGDGAVRTESSFLLHAVVLGC